MSTNTIPASQSHHPTIPHILLLPDGHRRFMQQDGLPPKTVYKMAARRVLDFIALCFREFPTEIVTVFLTRPATYEYSAQMRSVANIEAMTKAIASLVEGLRAPPFDTLNVNVIGETRVPPQRIREHPSLLKAWRTLIVAIDKVGGAQQGEENIPGLDYVVGRLNLLINYSGSRALSHLAEDTTSLETMPDMLECELGSPVGLLIRTGDGLRLSDGPAHQLYDARCVLIPKLFPEVTEADVNTVLREYFATGG